MDIIENTEEIQALAEGWDALPGPSSNPLLSYDWFEACARATSPHAKTVIAVLRRDKAIRAIAPLAVTCRNGIATFELLSDPICHLYEPSDLIYADDEALFDLLDGLKTLGKPLFLSRISASSQTAAALSDSRNGLTSIPLRSKSHSLFLPITGSWTDFEATISTSRRARLRRRANAAKKMGAVAYDVARPNLDDYLGYLKTFMGIERSGWKGKNGTSLAQHHQQREFFERYFAAISGKKQLVVFTMTIDEKPIAMRFAVDYGHRLWELKIAYDEAYRKCAPGILLTHETLRYAFDQAYERYEFLGESEDWEHLWTDKVNDYRSFGLYPLSPAGVLGLGMFVANYAKARTGRFLSSLKGSTYPRSAA